MDIFTTDCKCHAALWQLHTLIALGMTSCKISYFLPLIAGEDMDKRSLSMVVPAYTKSIKSIPYSLSTLTESPHKSLLYCR